MRDFVSNLARKLEDFLDYKHALGIKYYTARFYLLEFDGYNLEHGNLNTLMLRFISCQQTKFWHSSGNVILTYCEESFLADLMCYRHFTGFYIAAGCAAPRPENLNARMSTSKKAMLTSWTQNRTEIGACISLRNSSAIYSSMIRPCRYVFRKGNISFLDQMGVFVQQTQCLIISEKYGFLPV